MSELALSTWAWVRETLAEGGFEARELARHCRVVMAGIDASLAAHERLRAKVDASGLSAADVGLDRLVGRLAVLREARAQVAEGLALAERPFRPVDEARLAAAKAASGRGWLVTIDDDYLARLRAGYFFLDGSRCRLADCVADDSAAVYGVLELVYLDCQAGT